MYFIHLSRSFHLPALKVSDRGAKSWQIQWQSRGEGNKRVRGSKKRQTKIANQAEVIKIHELEAGLDLCI